jgi:hypothetical protein
MCCGRRWRKRAALSYNPKTGEFRWRTGQRAGIVAGRPNARGYLYIGLDGRTFAAHRLAWFYAYGEWPRQWIDHINHDRRDNRLCNLRDVSPKLNSTNRAAANKYGYCGVKLNQSTNKFEARYGKRHLGLYHHASHAAAVAALTRLIEFQRHDATRPENHDLAHGKR